jgi:hypothetical protein
MLGGRETVPLRRASVTGPGSVLSQRLAEDNDKKLLESLVVAWVGAP